MALRAIGLLREPDIDRVGANIGNPCSCAMKVAPILSDNCDGLPSFKCDRSLYKPERYFVWFQIGHGESLGGTTFRYFGQSQDLQTSSTPLLPRSTLPPPTHPRVLAPFRLTWSRNSSHCWRCAWVWCTRSAGALWNTVWCSFDRVYRRSVRKRNMQRSAKRRCYPETEALYSLFVIFEFCGLSSGYHVESWTTFDLFFFLPAWFNSCCINFCLDSVLCDNIHHWGGVPAKIISIFPILFEDR